MSYERVASDEVYSGLIATVRIDTFRHDDGEEVKREYVAHPGAVVMLAHDNEVVYLVRQPREAAGLAGVLELPAGKLDQEGEAPEQTARRELAEEIGMGARSVEYVKSFYSSPGFTDELMHLYNCTGLYAERAEAGEEERIEVVRWPLDRLDDAISETPDGKTLVGLLWFRSYLLGR